MVGSCRSVAAVAIDEDSDLQNLDIPAPTTVVSSKARRGTLTGQTGGALSQVTTSLEAQKARDRLDAHRSTALLLLFKMLSPTEQVSFGTILSYKTKVILDMNKNMICLLLSTHKLLNVKELYPDALT